MGARNNAAISVASRSQRVSLIVCLSVCRSFRDLQPTTIDRSQPNLVGPRTRVSLFGSPISHTLGARGKICAYSCHCERDASCHMTCSSVRPSVPFARWFHGMPVSNCHRRKAYQILNTETGLSLSNMEMTFKDTQGHRY